MTAAVKEIQVKPPAPSGVKKYKHYIGYSPLGHHPLPVGCLLSEILLTEGRKPLFLKHVSFTGHHGCEQEDLIDVYGRCDVWVRVDVLFTECGEVQGGARGRPPSGAADSVPAQLAPLCRRDGPSRGAGEGAEMG